MSSPFLPKSSFLPFLVTLFMTIQLSACGAEEFFSAIAPEVDAGADAVIENTAKISGIATGSVIEDVDPDGDNLLEVGGKLDITGGDPGEAAFVAKKINGDYGDLDIDSSGTWNYAADNDQTVIQELDANATLTDTLTVSTVGGTTSTVAITIIGVVDSVGGTNSEAVISGADNSSVTEDVDPDSDNLLETNGKLNITDSDPGEAAFIATTINGNYGGLIIDAAGNWAYAANNNQTVIQNLNTGTTLSDNLIVRSFDGTSHSVSITISGADETNTPADISLSWVAPVEREDNAPISLSEIAGYKIYYGSAQGLYPDSVTVNDGSAVDYIFQNFAAGTYYFVVTTIDTAGRESGYSTEVIFTI